MTTNRAPAVQTNDLIVLFTQDGHVCTPEGRTCIEERSNKDYNCTVNCEGIYTDIHVEKTTLRQCDVRCGVKKCDVSCDVQKTREDQDSPAEMDKLVSELMKEYNAHKKKKLRNIRFSSSQASTMFGK